MSDGSIKLPTADAFVPSLKRAIRRGGGFVGSVVAVQTDRSDVVLTYDDGPEAGSTGAVIAALAGHGATATFFLLLTRARRHPGLVRDLVASGHEVALHGSDHRRLTSLSPSEVRRRMRDGRRELEDLSEQAIRWIRPPYGAQTVSTWTAAKSAGLTPVLWGSTVWDWKDIPQTERVDRVRRTVRAGSILLCHDAFASADDSAFDGAPPEIDRGELARLILETLRERGLSARSLGDALLSGRLIREARFRR